MIRKNLSKRMVSIVLVMLMVLCMVACGSETSTTSNEATIDGSTSSGSDTVTSVENSSSNETQDVVAVEETSVEETLEPEYEEYEYFYQDKNFVWSGDLILDYQSLDPQDYQVEFEDVDDIEMYGVYDSIDLYTSNGKAYGYTKPNIVVQLCATSEDGWGVVNIGDYTRYIRMEDLEGNSVLVTDMDSSGNYIIPEKGSTTTSSETTSTSSNTISNESTTSKETNNTTSNSTTNETSTNVSNTTPTSEVETQVVDNSKYTPDEAIAAYRAIMESSGITWDPSLPNDGASWGTGWFELSKDYVEWAGESSVASYKMGDSVGNAWTRYYLEVTGSDENKVYVKEWHN
jgi:hypothetical protein